MSAVSAVLHAPVAAAPRSARSQGRRPAAVAAPRVGAFARGSIPTLAAHRRPAVVVRAEGGDEEPSKPAYDEDLPPWARNEAQRDVNEDGLPFPVYLLMSVIVAIAAVGSIFEYTYQNPIFGVVGPDNFLYTPILGFFAITGFPTAGVLFKKCIDKANAISEDMDKQDGAWRE